MLKIFLQEEKLFVLIDYKVVVIDYNKLFEAWSVEFRIGLINYSSLNRLRCCLRQ